MLQSGAYQTHSNSRIDGTSCHCLASTGKSYIHKFKPKRNLKTIQKLGLNRELFA
jgi:hypothetical protein